MADQQHPSTNESSSWVAGALITAVTTSLVLFITLISRYLQKLSPPPPETPAVNPIAPLPLAPTLSDHDYNPDYDYHIESPPWGRYTKIFVAVAVVLLLIATAQRFQSLIAQLVIAAIVAYILNPIINFVDRRTKVERGTVLIVTYLLLATAVIWGFWLLGVTAFQQTGELIDRVPTIVADITTRVEEITTRNEPITIGPLSYTPNADDWIRVQDQVVSIAQSLVNRGGQLVTQILTGTVSVVGNMLFVFVLSIYIAIEIPKLSGYVGDFAQTPGYRKDAERLMREFARIWSAYLRGQVILGLTIGVIVWLGLALLGVENSGALGLLSGLLEFIPIIGPVIGAGAAMIVAFFQTSHCGGIFQFFFEAGSCGLAGWQFTLIVLGLMFVIQQLENNILVPRIVGEALDLHPLLVMIAVFMGGSLAGILGAILAAPVAATLKLIGIYVWRKMFDDYPFQQPEVLEAEVVPPQTLPERLRYLVASLRSSRS
ncbi:MAG: AI-2E family transporter [Ardenticatenaceae bacterium]|nr:AI-2E family transporter [Ardenticatenaceae bacterium]